MSPYIHSCVLCGYKIGDFDGPPSWADRFRILYSIKNRVAVSGVGLLDDPGACVLAAPLDFDERRDTFPFHEACWSLLEQSYISKPIPHRRLFEVCRSLPFSDRVDCVTWGHDFGGLISAEDDSYPWQDLFVDRELTFASDEPYVVPEIQQLPYETPTWPDISQPLSTKADIFAKIPPEIITSISRYLPTVDYLNARLASRSFYPVFHGQQFWASRFLPNADRSWVFESQKWEMANNWLWLYRRTANGTPGMKNRERVWRLVEKVKEILCLEWIEPISNPIPKANINWRQASGDLRPDSLQPPYPGFHGGCRKFHEKQVRIPPSQLSHLAFSLIKLGNVTYITGMRLTLTRDGSIRLGYMADEEHTLDITCLTGFNVAVGSRGIQSIQCILDNTRESPWIGCADNAPKTKRLGVFGPITGIKAAFDVTRWLA